MVLDNCATGFQLIFQLIEKPLFVQDVALVLFIPTRMQLLVAHECTNVHST